MAIEEPFSLHDKMESGLPRTKMISFLVDGKHIGMEGGKF